MPDFFRTGKFNVDDFRSQIVQMKKMGSVKDVLGKIPGMSHMAGDMEGVDLNGEVKRIQGIIDSMTPTERIDPHMIEISRRSRIAVGAGVSPSDVTGLVKAFKQMRDDLRGNRE